MFDQIRYEITDVVASDSIPNEANLLNVAPFGNIFRAECRKELMKIVIKCPGEMYS